MILNPWGYFALSSLVVCVIFIIWGCVILGKIWKHIKENEMIDVDVDFHESMGRIAWIMDHDSQYWDYLKYQMADALYQKRYDVVEPDETPLTLTDCRVLAHEILLQIFPWPPHRQSGG